MPQVTIRNPRLTATAEIELDDGYVVSVTFEKDDSELTIIQKIKSRVAADSAAAVAAGRAAIAIPTDEDLVPALAALNRMRDTPRDVSV